MAKKVRIGILGCANIAAKYAIKAFNSIANAEVTAIASRDLEKANDWAGRFGIKKGTDYESLINDSDVDAVYIPLPIGLHKEWILRAAAAGKHAICEKSLAENLQAAEAIVTSCKKNGVVLYENFMCDFHPQHQKVRSLIQDGAIGAPFIFQGYFGFPLTDKDNFRFSQELGGGALNDAGAYTIFMARKIMGSEPTSVTAALFYDEEKVDIKGVAILEFPNKMAAHLSFSFDAIYQNNYSVWGSKGLIKIERAYSIPPDMKPVIKLITNQNLSETITEIDAPAANHFELIFKDFCDTILNKKAGKINKIYSNIMNQSKAMEAIRISAKEGRKVKIAGI
ncbi:MAG: Gfo/Idh/MocA family oxidoreductase [Patescibacteria group bacterium]